MGHSACLGSWEVGRGRRNNDQGNGQRERGQELESLASALS